VWRTNKRTVRIVEALNLFILWGMGGEAHGEVASAMGVDVIKGLRIGEGRFRATVLDEAPCDISSQKSALEKRGGAGEFSDFPGGT